MITFTLSETFGINSPRVVAVYETEVEAVAKLNTFKIAFTEADKDFPGCHDAISVSGQLFTIERSPRVNA